MNLHAVYRGRSFAVCSMDRFEVVLDFVEQLEGARERFPMLLRCEGRQVHYSRKETAELASELVKLAAEIEQHSEADLAVVELMLARLAQIVLLCVRNRRPVYIETSGRPERRAGVSSHAGC